MQEPLSIEREHTAVLIMDYQNSIVNNYAGNHPDLLERAATILNAGREAGLPIIYIVVRFREGYPEVSSRNRLFAGIRASGRMLEGSQDGEVHPRVAPQPGDIVVAKKRVGAFSTTDLETILRAQGITTLILLGIATSGVVLSTVR